MRGLQKLRVAATLTGAAAASGGLLGLALGVLALGLPAPGTPMIVAVVVIGALADLASLRWPWLRAWSTGRQVPVEWSRLFSPAVVALLYGARLGVGPMTILPTWLWWSAALASALLGPWTAALAGLVFGATRALVSVGVAQWAAAAMARRMATVRLQEQRIALIAPLLTAAVMLSA